MSSKLQRSHSRLDLWQLLKVSKMSLSTHKVLSFLTIPNCGLCLHSLYSLFRVNLFNNHLALSVDITKVASVNYFNSMHVPHKSRVWIVRPSKPQFENVMKVRVNHFAILILHCGQWRSKSKLGVSTRVVLLCFGSRAFYVLHYRRWWLILYSIPIRLLAGFIAVRYR